VSDQPPAEFLEFVRNYRCGHCPADTMEIYKDEAGLWHGNPVHADGCPVKAGAVSSIPDSVRALPEGARWRRD